MFSKSNTVVDAFKKNQDEKKAMASLVTENKQNAVVDQKTIESDFKTKIEALKKTTPKQDLEKKAKEGDVAALACLGEWHLKNGDLEIANSYFEAVQKSSLNKSNGFLEHMIGTWLSDDPESQAQYFYHAVSKGHYESATLITTITSLPENKDLPALICLGRYYLKSDPDQAKEYFLKAHQSPNNNSKGVIEHMIGTWLGDDPKTQEEYFYHAVSKGHFASVILIKQEPDENMKLKATEKDLSALICLGAWHLKQNDIVLANQYFQEACNSLSNKSQGLLEYTIGTFIEDPYVKAKYFHLAGDKGYSPMELTNALIKCFPTTPIVGTLHGLIESDSVFAQGYNYKRNAYASSLISIINTNEFKFLCISVSKEKLTRVLPTFGNSSLNNPNEFLNRYQSELVNFIFSDMIRNGKSILDNSTFDKDLKEAQKAYEAYYHPDYFKDMPQLIKEKAQKFESEDASNAMLEFDKMLNNKIRTLFTDLSKLDKTEYKPPEQKLFESTLTKDDIAKLNTYLAETPTKKDTIKRQSMILELKSAKEVHDVIFPQSKNEVALDSISTKKDTNTARFLRVSQKINEVSTNLTSMNTEASKKAARSWAECIALWSTILLGIGIILVPIVELFLKYESRSVLADKQAAGVTAQVSKQPMAFFKELSNKAENKANELLPPTPQQQKSKQNT